MLKKNKRNLMLMSGLAGSLIVSTAAGVALSSCTTTSSSTNDSSSDIQYSDIIDWNDADIIKNLVVDNQGLVYSSNAMTEIIGVSPNIALPTVTIPSTVKSITGYKKVVTTNGVKTYQSVGAFEGLTSIISIVLPSDSQLESIGGAAFQNCSNLMSIQGSVNSLKFVGNYAFNGCTNLSTINLSDVISVGNYAFNGCTSLKTAFDSTRTDKTGSLIIVGNYAFNGCTNLTDVNLSKTLTIGNNAFYGCTSLANTYTTTDATIQTIGSNAFNGCTSLAAINLSNVTSMGSNAFNGCTSLTSVDISKMTSVPQNGFSNCTSLVTVTSPNITRVNQSGFQNCSKLETIDLSKVTVIVRYSFQNCRKLRDVGSLENLLTDGLNAFQNAFDPDANVTLKLSSIDGFSEYSFQNSGVRKIDFSGNTRLKLFYGYCFAGSSVQEIDFTGCTALGTGTFVTSSFQNCKDLTTVYIPTTSNFKQIYSSMFSGCSSLTTVAPKAAEGETQKTGFVATPSMTTIGNSAFANTAITSIDLTDFAGTTIGGTSSFAYMTKLSSVTLNDIVTRLDASSGIGLFYGSGLESDGFDLVLPSSVTNVNVSGGASPFTNSGLRSIDMSKITSYWNSGGLNDQAFAGLFYNVPKLEKVILKPGTTTIGNGAFVTNPLLSTVVIPNSSTEDVSSVTGFRASSALTSIGTGNFDSTSLTTIDLTSMTGANVANIASSFTNLPTTAVVKLPSSTTSLNATSFTTTASTSANVQYPGGITLTSSITNGKLSGAASLLGRVSGSLDLTSNTTLTSIGENTFFGSSLESLTLPAASIGSANLFSTAQTITTGTSNTTTPTSYTSANVPFGSNASLSGLNYSGFSTGSTASATSAAALFEATTQDTWTAVAKVINSLSNYTYLENDATTDSGAKLPVNLSAWSADTTQSPTAKVNTDSVSTYTAKTASAAASVSLTNTFADANATGVSNSSITSSTTSASFIHNGILWTYSNDGTNITLTGDANMYKLNGTGSNTYLTFFNTDQVLVQPSEGSSVTYNIPSQSKVTVKLTIATKASS